MRDEDVGLDVVDVVQVVADDPGQGDLPDLLQLGWGERPRVVAIFVPESVA